MTPTILSQIAPLANTETTLYQVLPAVKAELSELIICNRSSSAASFRISISRLGAATANTDYLYFNTPIGGNDTLAAELDVTLDSTDIVRVFASSANITFCLFGQVT